MKRNCSLMLALALVFVMAMPALAGEGKAVTMTGWITDEACGAKNANAKGKDCAIACAKKGSPLMLYSNDKLYKLSDQELAMKHVGYQVKVTGVVSDEGIKVTKIEKAGKA